MECKKGRVLVALSRPFTVVDQLGGWVSEPARCVQWPAEWVGCLVYKTLWDRQCLIFQEWGGNWHFWVTQISL
jgi:hypothetical protein